jgi:hypothetical protein
MTNKTIQFLPGDTDSMREYAVVQYIRLMIDFSTFQIDDEYLDACIDELVPADISNQISRMGSAPLIASDMLTESMLDAIIRRLDAVVEFAEEGEEFDMWCEFYQEEDGTIRVVSGN